MKRNFILKIVALCFFTGLLTSAAFGQQTGKITGKITDKSSGETIPGLSVKISGTAITTASNVDGIYALNTIKPGTYSIEFTYLSFIKQIIGSVEVKPGETTKLDVTMEPEVNTLTEAVITGRRVTSTDMAVINEIKLANVIVSGISSQIISKSGDSDAAQVVKRVSGITISGNRFINVRGLSERYNNVQLNGVNAPSLEADVRSFGFDIIPSNQIDRILVFKSPSAELPSDFSGGTVKVFTKSIPDENSLQIEYGSGYRENATFRNFKQPVADGLYWTGFNTGYNDLPSNFPRNLRSVSADKLVIAGKSLNNSWLPQESLANLDQKVNIAFTKRFNLNNKLLGNITSINYGNNKTIFNMDRSDFNTPDPVSGQSSQIYEFNDMTYNYNVKLGIMHNWAFTLSPAHTFEFKNLFNQLSTTQYTNRTGQAFEFNYLPDNGSFNQFYRGVYTGQLTGIHKLFNENLIVDWSSGYSISYRNQPDYRRFRSDIDNDGTRVLYVPTGAASSFFLGRFFSNMNENTLTGVLNAEQKLKIFGDNFNPAFKVGGYFENKDRSFLARNIGYTKANSSNFDNRLLYKSINNLFKKANINNGSGIRIDEQSNPNDSYSADNQLLAAYLNFVLPFKQKWTLVAGVRAEHNVQQLFSKDDSGPVTVDNPITRILPSANFTYNLTSKSLLRVAYGQTLNRPEFRELAPFSFYDFETNFTNKGNSLLKTASIHNFDIKGEIYPDLGEVISLSIFYKKFFDPIETVFVPGAGSGGTKNFTYSNATSAENKGIELEFKKSLSGFTRIGFINNLSLLINASYINSEVNLSDLLGQPAHRPLQGQSNYIFNTGIFYSNNINRLQVNLLYNIVGKRILYVGYDGYPDVYEMPRNIIDLNINKAVSDKWNLKFALNDILNQNSLFLQDLNSDTKFSEKNDQIIQKYKPGRLFNVGLTYRVY